jgi:hypothetical protein
VSKRRANGDGSVYTRKDGRVVGEWTDANGRARYITSTKIRPGMCGILDMNYRELLLFRALR